MHFLANPRRFQIDYSFKEEGEYSQPIKELLILQLKSNACFHWTERV